MDHNLYFIVLWECATSGYGFFMVTLSKTSLKDLTKSHLTFTPLTSTVVIHIINLLNIILLLFIIILYD